MTTICAYCYYPDGTERHPEKHQRDRRAPAARGESSTGGLTQPVAIDYDATEKD
jgi:hypothetical protein